MLNGNIAIVTGGAQGMGEVHAKVLAEKGAIVILTDVDVARGEAVAQAIGAAGGTATFIRHDVAREEDWNAVIAAVTAQYGKVDTLVNNAGILIRIPIEELSVEDFDRLHAINVRGTFLGCRAVIPAMRAAGGGSIINISSMSGNIANMPGMAGYCATKGAVRMLTKAAAVDLARYNIRVNSVHPGTIATPMTASYYADPDLRRLVLGTTIMERPGEPREVSEVVAFLASAGSSYMTGSEVAVDGGYTAA
jgi:NAD(P)-dependent dehydrogenase (short-subunit alcohol dehydrogenase family)